MGEKKSEYTADIATHYKSFRPPLHEILLKRSFKNQRFESALDIGCGTGNSTIALAKYCASVTGYDPNKSRLFLYLGHNDLTVSLAIILDLII